MMQGYLARLMRLMFFLFTVGTTHPKDSDLEAFLLENSKHTFPLAKNRLFLSQFVKSAAHKKVMTLSF